MNCGVGDYAYELIKSLRNKGAEIAVVTSFNKKITQFNKDFLSSQPALFPVVKRWDFMNIPAIIKTINSFLPDVIHIQYHWWVTNDGFIFKGLMAVFLPLILKLSGIRKPIICTLHSRLGGPYLFPGAGILRKYCLLPLLLFSSRIIVTNKFDGRKLSQWLPFLKTKIEYTVGGAGHYLIDVSLKEEAAKIKSQIKKNDDEIILSNFGFMIPHKGLEELLESMSVLRNKGYPLRLLAIGGYDIEVNFAGSYFERLQKKAQDLKLGPYIIWTGFCDSRKASLFLLASDICVMPFPEGVSEWRSSFLDALSHGIPVVTTYSERTPEEVIDRANCLLVPPGDSRRLASAIEELLIAPGLRQSLGKAARQLYVKEYDWPIIAEKTISIYIDGMRDRRLFN
jgi:glycosyltransferase involved in cell wall biosynthesis